VNNFNITNVTHDSHITVIIIDSMITPKVSNSRNIMWLIITTIVTNACKTLGSIIFLPTLIELIMKSAKQLFFGCAFFLQFFHLQDNFFLGFLSLDMTIMLLVYKQCTARDYNGMVMRDNSFRL
jgi:hypothetical protein